MKLSEKLLLTGAVLVALFGLFMMLGAVINIFDGKSKDSVPGDVALFVFVGIVPLLLGIWLFRYTRMRVSRRALEAREQTVLHLARSHEGTLTVPQVAEEAGMTLEEAKAVLDRLFQHSFNEMTLLDSGETAYRFQL
jgi:hypothetical protein